MALIQCSASLVYLSSSESCRNVQLLDLPRRPSLRVARRAFNVKYLMKAVQIALFTYQRVTLCGDYNKVLPQLAIMPLSIW